MNPYEREEQIICEQYSSGQISLAEYNKALRDLQREAQGDREERAEQAYRDAYENF